MSSVEISVLHKSNSSSSNGGASPSRKFGPMKNLFKVPQIKLCEQQEVEEMLEDEDYIAKEVLRRQTKSLKQKSEI